LTDMIELTSLFRNE